MTTDQIIHDLTERGHVGIKRIGFMYRVVFQPNGKEAKDAIVVYSADPANGGPLIDVLREVAARVHPPEPSSLSTSPDDAASRGLPDLAPDPTDHCENCKKPCHPGTWMCSRCACVFDGERFHNELLED